MNNTKTEINEALELRKQVLNDIDEHRDLQLNIWGVQNNSAEMWNLIALEEFGEIANAIQQQYKDPNNLNWEHVYEETIQTIGVLTAFSESLLKKNPEIKMPDYDVEKMKRDRGLL